MIVLDANLGWAFGGPTKNYAPLVIDPDRVKPAEISLECFQPIARRNGKVLKPCSSVHLNQLSESDPGDECESSVGFVFKKLARIRIGKILNHSSELH